MMEIGVLLFLILGFLGMSLYEDITKHRAIERGFDELLCSDRYKNSKYKVEKVNGSLTIKNTETKLWINLNAIKDEYDVGEEGFKYCKGNKIDIILAFEYCEPEVVEVTCKNLNK